MAVKTFRPIPYSRREQSVADFSELSDQAPHKALTKGKKRISGRNNNGRITMRRRGGGHKKKYRIVDFRRDKIDIPATVASIEYDPNRSARIALLFYIDGEKRYILAPQGLKVGDKVVSGSDAPLKPGNTLPLSHIPLGETVHNIELRPGAGGKMVRTAGGGAQLMALDKNYATLRMPSGEIRRVLEGCCATLGAVGNSEHENVSLGKAGRTRHRGRRSKVRGVVMNPVDHPMGGGEGRSSGGRHPCTPWGKPTKGYRTRNRKKASSNYIVKRRK